MNTVLKSEPKRESNFELLRIIAMLGIVLFHYSDHGCNDISYDNALAINNAFECFCRIGGGLGNCVFMILTGYFMSKTQFRIRKLLKVWTQVVFYSVLSYIVACSLELTYFSGKDFLNAWMPITSNQYWYFTAYIIIYFISPIINCAVDNIEKKQIGIVICALFWFFSVLPTCGYNYTTSNNRIGVMVLLYFLGAYIRKYHFERKRKELLIESALAVLLLLLLSGFSIFYEKSSFLQSLATNRFDLIWGIEKIYIIVFSALIFLVFKNIRMRVNRTINWIAASAFGVYLLHMNNWTTNIIWDVICRAKDYYQSSYMIAHVIFCSLLIYAVCTIIDKFRIYFVAKPVENAIDNISKKRSKVIIAVVSIVIIIVCVGASRLRLSTPYSSSLLYTDGIAVVTMEEDVDIQEDFYCLEGLEIRKIVFHTITWNYAFSNEQMLKVSIVDSLQNEIFVQQIPMNQFVDQGDYELKVESGVKLKANEWYQLIFSSNTENGQQSIALLLTEKSNNDYGQCTVNGTEELGHIAASILAVTR